LAKVPKGILDKILRMFSFFVNWLKKKRKYTFGKIGKGLLSQKKKKKKGGWVLKTFFWFGKALTTKSLWRSLMILNL
jgi:hypothetical protein